MNARHSTATPVNEYQPTIIESGLLLRRLAIEFAFFRTELTRACNDFKNNPKDFVTRTISDLFDRSRTMVHAVPATSIALVLVGTVITIALLVDRDKPQVTSSIEDETRSSEVVMLDLTSEADVTKRDSGTGKDGQGRVGFQNDKGEGSGPTPKLARGGGSGGDRDPVPPQAGKLPPPSPSLAAIPKAPPVHPPSLPVAGMDIDPALWKDLKAPVYGDPRSNSEVLSKGPGEGGGIGTNRGLGTGEGDGPGFGKGRNGNTGGGSNEPGCCGIGGGPDGDPDRTFTGPEVEQRARLLSKPEPQYTEEARRNQITGTVTLRVVFSSAGEVVQIRAVRTLPFGLTERAIGAARQIRFIPALKGGRAVSVHMQLEYNFNLY